MADPEVLVVDGSSVPIDRAECRDCRAVRFADANWRALLAEQRAHLETRAALKAAEERIAELEGQVAG